MPKTSILIFLAGLTLQFWKLIYTFVLKSLSYFCLIKHIVDIQNDCYEHILKFYFGSIYVPFDRLHFIAKKFIDQTRGYLLFKSILLSLSGVQYAKY